jgi:hypothetical protein
MANMEAAIGVGRPIMECEGTVGRAVAPLPGIEVIGASWEISVNVGRIDGGREAGFG